MAHKIRPDHVKIGFWNADGLHARREEAEEFVHDHNLDIFMVGETHLHAALTAKIQGYRLYRADRPTRGGGTAIYVRNCLSHHEATTPQLTTMEANTVIVDTTIGPIRFVSTYIRPGNDLPDEDLDALLDTPTPIILAGDLNAKNVAWHSRCNNTRGVKLQRYADNNNLTAHGPVELTYHCRHRMSSDVLDILLARDVRFNIEVATVVGCSSDHDPVVGLLSSGAINTDNLGRTTKVCWPRFADLVEERVVCAPPLSTPQQVDDAVVSLHECLRKAMQDASREIKSTLGVLDFPAHIKDLIREKNRARRDWQRYYNVDARNTMHRLVREIRDALKEYRNERWAEKLESLQTQDLSLWRMVSALKGKQRRTMPPITSNNRRAESDADKCELFAERLELQCAPNVNLGAAQHIAHVNETVESFRAHPADGQYVPISPQQVARAIEALPLRKAPGPDGVPNIALRHLRRKGLVAISNIFVAALRLRHFPTPWKVADVVLIPKRGTNPSSTDGYRPISLLPTVGKLFEKILSQHLQDWTDGNNILPNEQHGFRRNHGTPHQLLRVTEYIMRAFNCNQTVCAAFLDIAKAFDKVWHEGLVYKLLAADAPHWLISVLDSFLQDRWFRVKIGEERSAPRPIRAGVPQGSVLAPLLFNIFSHDMPRPHWNAAHAQYADDVAILSRSFRPHIAQERLQSAVNAVEQWYKTWRISVNPSKSVGVHFTRAKRPQTLDEVRIFDAPVPWGTDATYLGVTMDRRLHWTRHIRAAAARARQARAALDGLMGSNSAMSLSNKVIIYKTIIRPMMVYAAPIWGFAGSAALLPLERVQNISLRRACGAPWYIRNADIRQDLQIPSVEEFIKKMAEKFFAGVDVHPNPTIAETGVDYTPDAPQKYKRPRQLLA